MRVLTTVLGEYVRAYDTRILQVPGLLFARLSHGGPSGDHPVLGLLGPHSLSAAVFYCTMPLACTPRRPRLRTGRPDPLLSCSPPPSRTLHFRHSEGAAGEPSDIAIVVGVSRRSRETPRTCRSSHPLETQIAVRSGLFTFLHVNYPLSLSLSRCLSPYLTAFDVDYLVCRCIAVRQHDAGRVLMLAEILAFPFFSFLFLHIFTFIYKCVYKCEKCIQHVINYSHIVIVLLLWL